MSTTAWRSLGSGAPICCQATRGESAGISTRWRDLGLEAARRIGIGWRTCGVSLRVNRFGHPADSSTGWPWGGVEIRLPPLFAVLVHRLSADQTLLSAESLERAQAMVVISVSQVRVATLLCGAILLAQDAGPLRPGKAARLVQPHGQGKNMGLPRFGQHCFAGRSFDPDPESRSQAQRDDGGEVSLSPRLCLGRTCARGSASTGDSPGTTQPP